ncbi:MAG: phage antirepressor KilAC domain-containing protein [Tissierellia bacterium]|nr:phage antirepressor KilAC domain-containing protein [Tissierellia bacterium]
MKSKEIEKSELIETHLESKPQKDKKSISITDFFKEYKEVMNVKEKIEFIDWMRDNYLAIKINGKDGYLATSLAIDNGYMINKRTVIIDIDDFKVWSNCYPHITPKGQEHILEIFKDINMKKGVNSNDGEI